MDRWVEQLWRQAAANPCAAEVLENDLEWPKLQGYPYQYGVRHNQGNRYVRFTPKEGEGYCTPDGINPARSRDPSDPLGWPQLPDTVLSGGTSLILASIFRDRGARCAAADEPLCIA